MAPKKEEDKKEGKGKKEEKPETPETVKKGRSRVLILGIAAILLAALGGGGFFVFKTFMGHKTTLQAKDGEPATGEHGATTKDEKSKAADKTKDAQSEPAKDAHGEPAKGAQSEPAKDAHGEPAKGAQSESAKDAHGNPIKTEAPKSEEKKGDDKRFGETMSLPKMELNLGNPLENRYIKLSVSLEYKGGKEQAEDLKKREPQIKDIVINSVNSKTRTDLLSPGGKDRLRREILNKLNEIVDQPVNALYFTDFLVE